MLLRIFFLLFFILFSLSSSYISLLFTLSLSGFGENNREMSQRKSFISRRISSRSFSFTLSKSLKDFKFSQPVHSSNLRDDDRHNDAVESEITDRDSSHGVSWSSMLPELLGEIIRRVEASEDRWPQRQNVVVCGCVCKRWRDVTREIVRSPHQSGKITFPSCLKQVLVVFVLM